jgi:hypothetical protein
LILCVFFVPPLANATPAPVSKPAVVEREGDSLLAFMRDALALLWGENGSGADPSGEALHGDNGSGADPDGNHAAGDNGAVFGPSSRF